MSGSFSKTTRPFFKGNGYKRTAGPSLFPDSVIIMKKLFILLVCLLPVLAQAQMETSVAGFIPLSGSGRIVYNFNPGWRFHRGDIKGAEAVRFDDTSWQVVSVPHTVDLMPAEASGCRN